MLSVRSYWATMSRPLSAGVIESTMPTSADVDEAQLAEQLEAGFLKLGVVKLVDVRQLQAPHRHTYHARRSLGWRGSIELVIRAAARGPQRIVEERETDQPSTPTSTLRPRPAPLPRPGESHGASWSFRETGMVHYGSASASGVRHGVRFAAM